jgi:hypothetical protein
LATVESEAASAPHAGAGALPSEDKHMTLRSVKQFHGFRLETLDGNAGSVKETLFDEEAWVIRYLVLETGDWLDNNEILIAPMPLVRLDWDKRTVYADFTSAQLRANPGIGVTQPILHTNEAEFLDHYGYTHYWTGLRSVPPAAASDTTADAVPQAPADASASERDAAERDLAQVASSLHSSAETIGCAIRTSDGTDGQVEDLQFDDASWDIAFFVIDPHDWSPERSVLVSPSHIERINWEEGQVALTMTRAELERCPKY